MFEPNGQKNSPVISGDDRHKKTAPGLIPLGQLVFYLVVFDIIPDELFYITLLVSYRFEPLQYIGVRLFVKATFELYSVCGVVFHG